MRARLSVFVATPAPAGSRGGNRITALRWAKRLRELGCAVRVAGEWRGEDCDVLVALHARRSHASIARHAEARPTAPRVVALTGTDLYGDIHDDPSAQASLELATQLVILQPLGLRQLPPHLHGKTHTIRQSARAPAAPIRAGRPGEVVVAALGHLRDVKDPLLPARAAALLPETSAIRIVHLGAAPDAGWRARVEEASRASHGRWQWLGERSRADALRILAGAQLLVLTSVSEGGANVVTEAIACGVPVLSTRIEGSLGILGDDYPGYFPVGDAAALAALLTRFEDDRALAADLQHRITALRPLVDPAHERESWRKLLALLIPERRP